VKSAISVKKFVDNERSKYGENSNTCIITLSGNYNSIGTVTNSNNEVTRILGFAKNDIIGQNINRIMPKIFADMHDGLLRSYFERSESKIVGAGLERIVYPQNKNGYLLPCTLMIKVLPNLDEGIRIVGFFKEMEESSELKAYDSVETVIKISFSFIFHF
jgi:PAS domain S-box-containing protein